MKQPPKQEGLNFEVYGPKKRHWVLYVGNAYITSGTARTRLGRIFAIRRATLRYRLGKFDET